jgi:hypothetical protein
MKDVSVATEKLQACIDEMKQGKIEASEFYVHLMDVLSHIEPTNEDLKGITPQLLSFVNGLMRNINK